MLNRLQKLNNKGFTIIEVMIVLAIAALILLIVLLAVPAVQRNSRNTAIKNDAGTIAGGIGTFESDNEGSPPTSITASNGTVTITDGTNTEKVDVQSGTAVDSSASAAASLNPGEIHVQTSAVCPGSSATASTRTFAIQYVIETSGGTSDKCVNG